MYIRGPGIFRTPCRETILFAIILDEGVDELESDNYSDCNSGVDQYSF